MSESIWGQFAEGGTRSDNPQEEKGFPQDGQNLTSDNLTPEQIATVKLFNDFRTIYEALGDKEEQDFGIKGAVRDLHLHNGDKIGFQLERGDFRFGKVSLVGDELMTAMYGSVDAEIPENEEVIALGYTLSDPRGIEALGMQLDQRAKDPGVRTYATIMYYLSNSGHNAAQPFVRMFTANGGEYEDRGKAEPLRPVNFESLESAAREIIDTLPKSDDQKNP